MSAMLVKTITVHQKRKGGNCLLRDRQKRSIDIFIPPELPLGLSRGSRLVVTSLRPGHLLARMYHSVRAGGVQVRAQAKQFVCFV